MRDFRINLIFEGSSEIMRLFIAREAVDTHLKIAGALIDPKAPMSAKLAALLRSGAVLRRVVSASSGSAGGARSATASSGRSPAHVRYVDRARRRLARTLFHGMVRFGPKLEKRQTVLGRLVEIGAELLAITAACSRAQAMVTQEAGQDRGPVELADLFCRQARRRVEDRFAAVFDNDDLAAYEVAQQVIRGEHNWLEQGMARWGGDDAGGRAGERGASERRAGERRAGERRAGERATARGRERLGARDRAT